MYRGDIMSDKTATVTIVGSYNVGLTMNIPRFPTEGETVTAQNFSEGPGGKGSNQAVAAARLGANTSFIGKVGEDQYGDDAIKLLKSENIDITHTAQVAETHTGVAFILVNEDGDNEITVAPGANNALDSDVVQSADDVIRNSDCLLLQFEVLDPPLITAAQIAADADVPVVLNPAPAREIPPSLVSNVDYLTPNESEALTLLDKDLKNKTNHERLGKELLGLGFESVIITQGSSGALLVSHNDSLSVAAPSVPVADTTGAGDAFNGALAVALGEGRPIEDATQFACRAGALEVTKEEVIPGLPDRTSIQSISEYSD
jgi:ribokinase